MSKKVIYEGSTEFDDYTVVEENYDGRPARVLYSSDLISAQSGVALDDRSELLFDYNERFMELIRRLRPQRILLIGGGAFTLPTAIVNEFSEIELDIIEIDKGLVHIAHQYFGFKPTSRTHVYIGDGTSLDLLTKRYDMIILDVFRQSNVPESFQTKKMAQKLKSQLRQNGVVAMNVIGVYWGVHSGLLKRLSEVMNVEFKKVEIAPAGTVRSLSSLWMPQNFIVMMHDRRLDAGRYLHYKKLVLPAVCAELIF